MADDEPREAPPLPYPVRRETRVCADCGKPIQPGQIYLPGQPLHVFCGREQS
jgi:hypothetical protein